MQLPDRLPLFPLPDHVLLPGLAVPFRIFEPRYRALFSDLLDKDPTERWLAVPRLAPGWQADYQGQPPIHPVAAAALLLRADHHPDGDLHIVVEGHARCRLEEFPSDHPYRWARPHLLPAAADPAAFADLVDDLATLPELSAIWGRLAAAIPPAHDAEGWMRLLDIIGGLLIADPDRRQDLLECPTLAGRAAVVRGEIVRRRRGHQGLWKPSTN
jgi:Lon protease-like protein